MIFKYGIIQFFRSKWISIVFAVFILMGLMLTLSCCIWIISDNNIREYENSFSTIGFAKQKGSGTEVVATWDAGLGDYIYSDKEIYPVYKNISELSFYDNYIIEPKQHPFYTAFSDNLRYYGSFDEKAWISRWGSIIVFEPYKTSVPNKPVKVKIKDVLWGMDSVGSDVWLCDHFNDNPQKIKAGHRYVTHIQSWPNSHKKIEDNAYVESGPVNMLISTQVLDKTASSKDDAKFQNWEEVRENDALQKWQELAKAFDRLLKSVTVTPMPSSQLIYEFHEGISSVVDGVDISKEQYEKGARVCLMPYKLALQNDIGVGDTIKLSFYIANFRDVPARVFYPNGSVVLNYGLLNKKGENYPIVEDIEYKIVGLYSSSNSTDFPTGYDLGANEIIVPEKSIIGDYSNNIVACGPMSGYNTSFVIPNGKAADYMSKMKSEGVKDIDITFYDNGYEELVSGMESMKQMAIISALVSLFALLISLLLFCYLVIQKQRRRTAIERLLGLTVKECYVSLPLTFLITIVIGSGIGGILGYYLTDYILNLLNSTFGNSFLLDYSIWNNSARLAVESPFVLWVPIAAVVLILLSAFIMTFVIMHLNLKNKPMNILAVEEGLK